MQAKYFPLKAEQTWSLQLVAHVCDYLLLLIFPEEVNHVLSCFCSLQRCSYVHPLLCLVSQLQKSLNKFQSYLHLPSSSPNSNRLLLHTCAYLALYALVGYVCPPGFLWSNFRFCVPPASVHLGDLLFPQLFSATCLVSLSSPRCSKNTSGCCVCIALERHLPDSVLQGKRRGKKKHSLSKPCHRNSVPAFSSPQVVAWSLASFVSNAVSQTRHSSYGCQKRALAKEERESNKRSETKSVWQYEDYLGFAAVTPSRTSPCPFLLNSVVQTVPWVLL